MEQTFLTELRIEKVRHLHDITIPLSKTERKNLILTGKNGSGKTSVLEELAEYIKIVSANTYRSSKVYINNILNIERKISQTTDPRLLCNLQADMERNYKGLEDYAFGTFPRKLRGNWVCDEEMSAKFHSGQFIIAYYGDTRKLEVTKYKHIEKVQLSTYYEMTDRPSRNLTKYLVDLKFTRLIAQSQNNNNRAIQIDEWFTRFEDTLRHIYGEPSLKLDFDSDTFQFSILIDGREPFDFNTMSMGYAAVFDIVADLMMRMESQRRYDLEGIVLIDEIETHLHVELQKQIVPILTELFPNIQFILTTHSPFILSSAPNAVIYDLEKHLLVSEGMKNLSYEGIVEGYFGVDAYSEELRNAFEEYKHLVTASELTDVQRARLAALRDYLDEVPDYLAREIAYEYSLLRLEYDD